MEIKVNFIKGDNFSVDFFTNSFGLCWVEFDFINRKIVSLQTIRRKNDKTFDEIEHKIEEELIKYFSYFYEEIKENLFNMEKHKFEYFNLEQGYFEKEKVILKKELNENKKYEVKFIFRKDSYCIKRFEFKGEGDRVIFISGYYEEPIDVQEIIENVANLRLKFLM